MKIKKIVIETEEELKEFYKSLRKYKSIFYKNVKFEIKSNKYNLKDFEMALNIKNRKERLKYVFYNACDYVDNYYKCENLCGFDKSQCKMHRDLKKAYTNGCCRCCRYQTSHGCEFKNLACKLFVCSHVKKSFKKIEEKDIDILRMYNWAQRELCCRTFFMHEKDVLRILYSGSILIGESLLVFITIRNIIVYNLNKKTIKSR